MTSWRVLRLLAVILLLVCWFLVAWTSAVCEHPDRKWALIDVGYTPEGLQFSMCLLDRWDYMTAVGKDRPCASPKGGLTRAFRGAKSKANLSGALEFRGKVKDGGGCRWQRSRASAFISAWLPDARRRAGEKSEMLGGVRHHALRITRCFTSADSGAKHGPPPPPHRAPKMFLLFFRRLFGRNQFKTEESLLPSCWKVAVWFFSPAASQVRVYRCLGDANGGCHGGDRVHVQRIHRQLRVLTLLPLLSAAEFLFLLWAVYLCYAVRTVPSAFHEPRYMAIAVHNELVLSAIFHVIR